MNIRLILCVLALCSMLIFGAYNQIPETTIEHSEVAPTVNSIRVVDYSDGSSKLIAGEVE